MQDKINKYDDIIINHYTNNCAEEDRFTTNSHKIEFLTTMRYIEKFAKKGCKILEVGAGTGAYSITLAKMGYDVTALELVPRNVEIMKKRAKGLNNIKCMVGDALNLPFENNEFDIVLNLGPMYHLYNQNDKDKAISETIRVCKPDGICMFAYLTHSAIIWGYGVRKNKLYNVLPFMTEDGKVTDVPDEVFSSYYIDDFKNQFKETNTSYITNLTTDGIFQTMQTNIDLLNEEEYNNLVKWHFTTCERLDHQGLSCHMLYICKKENKNAR